MLFLKKMLTRKSWKNPFGDLESSCGMAIKKGDSVAVKWRNNFLKKIKQDGRYNAIYNKWFKSYTWCQDIN